MYNRACQTGKWADQKGQPFLLGVNPMTQVKTVTINLTKCLPCLPFQKERECGGMLGHFYSPGPEVVHITSAYVSWLRPVMWDTPNCGWNLGKCGPAVSLHKIKTFWGKANHLFHTASSLKPASGRTLKLENNFSFKRVLVKTKNWPE